MADPAPVQSRSSATCVPAIVLAGGRTSPEFAAAAGVSQRALADINGWTMIRYVIEVLRRSETVGRVLLVAPEGFPPQPNLDLQIAGDGTLSENISAGLACCGDASHALLITADVPFLTPAAVDDYVRRCWEAQADCCYAAVPRAACEKQFPGTKRTYVRVSHESVTGGNAVFLRGAAFPQMAQAIWEAHLRRKNPLYLTRMIGAGNAFKLVSGQLLREDIEQGASRLMGVRCRLIVSPYAEIGTDVDKPVDLVLARSVLRPHS